MLDVVGSSRPVQSVGNQTLTYTLPLDAESKQIARKGDVLLLAIAHSAAVTHDSLVGIGWSNDALGLGATTAIGVWVKIVGDEEPTTVVVTSCDNTAEWHGQLLVLRGGQPGTLVESANDGPFTADATPVGPTLASQQAINLALAIWSATSAVDLEPPAGMTKVDDYQTALVAARTFLIAYARVKTTIGVGNYAPGDATSAPASTGHALFMVLRDSPPRKPPELYDPIPGHIGLTGKDGR